MPSRWTLTLTAERPDTARRITPVQLHGATADLVEGSFVDHRAQTKPYSVTPLINLGYGRAELRISWLSDTHRLDLSDRTAEPVRFGAQLFRVLGARETRTSYADLRRLPQARRARMTFHTPTYFARAGRWYPLPDPTLLYGGLIRRWNTYAPPKSRVEESDQKLLVDALTVAEVDITSEDVRLGANGAVRVGFRGKAAFMLTGSRHDCMRQWFTTLSMYADLVGVGAQTTHGLGVTEVQLT